MSGPEPPTLPRFTRAERVVHRTTAVLMLTCIATAAILYNGSLAIRVGHRHLIALVHVYCGLALPIPMLAGLASMAYRMDVTRLNRFTADDRRWLFSPHRRQGLFPVGKFNAGQKINSWLSAAAILVLTGTGTLMYFTHLAPLGWRTGATFVHDWFALGVGLLVAGHIYYAVNDPEARRGMRRGSVDTGWALTEHNTWAEEQLGSEPTPRPDGAAGPPGAAGLDR